MLPPLNEHGDLPAGVHVTDWVEMEQRFGTGSKVRVHAFAALKRLHQLATGTGALRTFYVFGSFVSTTPEPRDVDVVLVMSRDFKLEDCPPQWRSLFSHLAAQARFGATIFWFREGAMPQELMRAWQMKRDGTLRGILEVP
jgi:hypothetical protein